MGNTIAFVLCVLIGLLFVGMGIRCFFAEKPSGFWANAETEKKVTDVKKYNRSMGKLWIVFGTVFVLLCTPMLAGQNSPLIILSILGIAFESIACMVVYTVVIEPKYTKK